VIRIANPAAENLLETGARSLIGQRFPNLLDEDGTVAAALADALSTHWDYSAQNVHFSRAGRESLPLACVVTPTDLPELPFIVELRPIEQQLRIAREERLVSEQASNRELIRNLAHEIKAELRDYTQVIIKEADRLQALMDRLLTPHRAPRVGPVNIHEVLERVRSLVLAEFSEGITIRRDYDPSLPDLIADKEQLIQVVLNVGRNAAQALVGRGPGTRGTITFRTRAVRQITIVRQRYRLALELQVIDDGPGIPEGIRERIFSPRILRIGPGRARRPA
jgi:two-component system nitrogen regulation sensor histidine kinase GlnL